VNATTSGNGRYQSLTIPLLTEPIVGSGNENAVLISGVGITVLPDSGAMFKRYGLNKRVKIRKSRCRIKPYGAAPETNLLSALGSFEALKEAKTQMKVVTWQLIKGDTQTAPLLSYNNGKDLGMILVINAISEESKQTEETSNVKEILEEYKD